MLPLEDESATQPVVDPIVWCPGSSRLYRLDVSQAQKAKESGDERSQLCPRSVCPKLSFFPVCPGEITGVAGTVFDFTSPRRLGQDIHNVPGDTGYDHNYCLRNYKPGVDDNRGKTAR